MKDIVGYEGKYAVDSQGTVFSLNYRSTGKTRTLKASRDGCGYLKVCLCKDGKQNMRLVHRLVAQAYLDNYSNDLHVDHIDNNKTNNCLTNLRMVTCQQNSFNTKAKGYHWHKKNKKWRACISLNGKKYHLGCFVDENDARQAYLDAKEKMHIIPT